LPFNYKGNVLAEHVKVACGTPGFRGTQFEKHRLTSFCWEGKEYDAAEALKMKLNTAWGYLQRKDSY